MSSATVFVEAELRGIEGMRIQEMRGRWFQAGGDEAGLMEAVRAGWITRCELDGFYIFWPDWSDLPPDRALLRLVGYPDWARFFVRLCESPKRMAAQAWQFRDELADRGADHGLTAVEDALFDLAATALPESPVASEEVFADWAVELWRLAIRHVAECWGKSEGSPALTDEGMEALWGCRAAYRTEARQRVGAAMRAEGRAELTNTERSEA